MPKILKLSDGTDVHMKERFTHRAETAYAAALSEGAVDRETIVTDEATGKQAIQMVRETPVVNHARAIEAALLVMVERVKKGEAESTPTPDWLGDLDENDYLTISEAMLEIRRSGRERGKKSGRGA